MKEIISDINSIKNSIESIEEVNDKKILGDILNIVSKIAIKVEEVIVNQEHIEENLQYIDDDLVNIQEELYEEVSIEDLNEIEDEYVEVSCNHCSKPLFVEKDVIENKKEIPCPFCNKTFKK